MARYRLPAALGGGEYEAASDDDGYPEVGFDLPGLGKRIWIGRADMVRVDPATPPLWSIVTVGEGEETLVFQHRAYGHTDGISRRGWFRAGSSRAHGWAEVCALGSPMFVMPVGGWERVELPWRCGGILIDVEALVGLGVSDSPEGFAALDADTARQAARALLAAADQLDQITREEQ